MPTVVQFTNKIRNLLELQLINYPTKPTDSFQSQHDSITDRYQPVSRQRMAPNKYR